MGKNRNYTNYSKVSIESTEQVDIIENEEFMETVESVEPVEVKQESKIETVKRVTGVVTDCARLNVREFPNSNAKILGIINVSTELTIIDKDSTKEFYKVRTSDYLEGYCMKRYVTILP